jgi:hypothetical protein
MEFYSATKKNETLLFVGEWMELENLIFSECSEAQKAKGCMFSLIRGMLVQCKYKHVCVCVCVCVYTNTYRTYLQK